MYLTLEFGTQSPQIQKRLSMLQIRWDIRFCVFVLTNVLQVYFELDLTNPYTIAALTSCQLLPRGLNLSQVVQSRKYIRLIG